MQESERQQKACGGRFLLDRFSSSWSSDSKYIPKILWTGNKKTMGYGIVTLSQVAHTTDAQSSISWGTKSRESCWGGSGICETHAIKGIRSLGFILLLSHHTSTLLDVQPGSWASEQLCVEEDHWLVTWQHTFCDLFHLGPIYIRYCLKTPAWQILDPSYRWVLWSCCGKCFDES